MASAQDVYLGLDSPAIEPGWSGKDMFTDWWTGNHAERQRQYREAQNEWNAQKLLTKAEWEREDSAYQRLVADMKKAGLNPYYALNQSSVSPYGSSGQSVYSTKGKSSSKSEEKGLDLKGLITTAILIAKLVG